MDRAGDDRSGVPRDRLGNPRNTQKARAHREAEPAGAKTCGPEGPGTLPTLTARSYSGAAAPGGIVGAPCGRRLADQRSDLVHQAEVTSYTRSAILASLHEKNANVLSHLTNNYKARQLLRRTQSARKQIENIIANGAINEIDAYAIKLLDAETRLINQQIRELSRSKPNA